MEARGGREGEESVEQRPHSHSLLSYNNLLTSLDKEVISSHIVANIVHC